MVGGVHAAGVAEVFAEAAGAFDELVSRLPDDRWDGPGLGEWDLRSLVGHTSRSIITVATYLDRPAEAAAVDSPAAYYALAARAVAGQGAAAVTERGRQAGLALGDDPRAGVHALVVEMVPRVVAAAADDRIIETVAGGMWLSDYLPTRTFELAVHSGDIAEAAGLELELPRGVLRASATLAAEVAVERGAGPGLLAALTGQHPLPQGFTVV